MFFLFPTDFGNPSERGQELLEQKTESPAAPEKYTAMLDVNLSTQEGERYRKFIRSLLHDCCKLQEAE